MGDDEAEAAAELDLRGLLCPEPVLRAHRALRAMAPGARLRLLSDDPVAAVDIPHFCRQRRHAILDQSREGRTLAFLIERGPDQS